MSQSEFYDQYWQREGGAPPEEGYAMGKRKVLLTEALKPLPQGSLVLDAGCGHGEFALHLAGLGYQVRGIDISQIAVEKARKALPAGDFQVQSLENGLSFRNEEFSAIWFTEVLEHLFDVHGSLAELNRVLTPGGRLILTTPYHGLLKNLAISLFGFENHFDPYLSHIRFFTRKSLQMCLERAGFRAIHWQGIGRFWPIWMGHFVVAEKISMPGSAPGIRG